MGQILGLIGNLCSLGAFIIAILMAVKMFKAQPPQIWQGILTIICFPFALIYSWMKKDELGLGNLPLLYTVLALGGIILAIVGASMAVASASAGS